MKEPLISIKNLSVSYRIREGLVNSVKGVSLDLFKNDVIALIGESGCGKSTLTSAILGTGAPNTVIDKASEILWEGENVLDYSPEKLRQFRWVKAAMIFQAAQNALNPTLRIEEQFRDTMIDHGLSGGRQQDLERINELLSMVRLEADRILPSYPHELSGGMRQRAIIALSMILNPKFLILDEPTTALDTITQHYIFDILTEVQQKTGTSMMLVTHDLSSAAKLCHRVGVMYAGQLVELGSADAVFNAAQHPYAAALINAMPSIEGDVTRHKAIPGAMPDLLSRPEGCLFHPRCSYAMPRCREERPHLEQISDGHWKACFLEKLDANH